MHRTKLRSQKLRYLKRVANLRKRPLPRTRPHLSRSPVGSCQYWLSANFTKYARTASYIQLYGQVNGKSYQLRRRPMHVK